MAQNGIWVWKNVLSKCMHNIKVMKIGPQNEVYGRSFVMTFCKTPFEI